MKKRTWLVLALGLLAVSFLGAGQAWAKTAAQCRAEYEGNLRSIDNDINPQMRHMQERASHLAARANQTRDSQLRRQYAQQRNEALRRYDALKAQKASRQAQARGAYNHCLQREVPQNPPQQRPRR